MCDKNSYRTIVHTLWNLVALILVALAHASPFELSEEAEQKLSNAIEDEPYRVEKVVGIILG